MQINEKRLQPCQAEFLVGMLGHTRFPRLRAALRCLLMFVPFARLCSFLCGLAALFGGTLGGTFVALL